jgi:hypothetical protein
VARGCWVLSSAWLEACLAAGTRAPEAAYEARGVLLPKQPDVEAGGRGAPERSRRLVAAAAPGVFAGATLHLANCIKGKERVRDLARSVAEAAGGAVVKSLAGFAPGGDVAVVTDDAAVAKGMRKRGWTKVVAPAWVLDSVTCCKLLPPTAYVMG